jgi:antitoxin component YwqK of YwqJK toxin-antitoxin module
MRGILTAVLMLAWLGVLSCSCFHRPSFYWNYNSADQVFKGKVLAETEYREIRKRVILFSIITPYKGNFYGDTLTLYTGLGDGDCGLLVEKGDIWVIFAYNRFTTICHANIFIGKQDSVNGSSLYKASTFLNLLGKIKDTVKNSVKEYDEKKKLISEGLLVNGVAEGYWTYYFKTESESGTAKEKRFYRSGILDSTTYAYYKNGSLHSTRNWKNGKLHGQEKIFYPNGVLSVSASYLQGQRDGYRETNTERGKPYSREYFLSDKPVKTCTHFYETGDTSFVIYFSNEGRPLSSISKFQSGKIEGTSSYHWEDSLYIQESTSYYENGNIRVKTSGYLDEKDRVWKSHGTIVFYYENGNMKEFRKFDKGKEVGTWLYYDEEGKLQKSEEKTSH